MSVRKNFAERLIQLRNERGLSRQQVADDLQISRASLEYYEKGKRAPDIETLYNIADYFHTSADYLLGRTPNKTTNPKLQEACNYTGLSEKAVENLIKMQDTHKNPFIYPFLTAQFLLENAYTDGENSIENSDSLLYKLSAYYRYNVPNSPNILHVSQSGYATLRDTDKPPTNFEKFFSSIEVPINDVLETVFLDGIRKAAETEKQIFEQGYLGAKIEKE